MTAESATIASSRPEESRDRPASDAAHRGGYLPEIDGLRCLAVGGVLLFHLDIAPLFGGYLGVDVFFVISGFLIIGAIRKAIAEKSFSLGAFYRRRFRRLYPALICTVALTVLAAIAIQLPKELKQTTDAAIASLLSLANFHFMVAGGYFEGNAQFRALLHTWSLSVEEQFYLVVPVALLALRKRPRLMAPFVFAVLGLSLGLLIAVVAFGALNISETTAFFMAPTRMWEFAIGGAVGFVSASTRDRPFVRALAIAGGVIGIVFAYVGLNPFARTSGFDALQPCMSAAVLLWAISALAPPRRPILATPALTLIGRASYSIYLVHWPIIVFYKYYTQTALTPVTQFILLGVSLGLGFVQYQLIEKRFRYPPLSPSRGARGRRSFWIASLGCALAVIGASLAIRLADGLPARTPATRIVTEGVSKSPQLRCADLGKGIRRCNVANRSSPRAIALVGDSHAEYILPRFAEAASEAGYDTLAYIEFGCPSALGLDTSSSSRHCASTRDRQIADLKRQTNIDAVFLVSRWNFYESGSAWDRKNNWLLDPDENWISRGRGPATNHRLLSAGIARLVDSLSPDVRVGLLLSIPQPDFNPKIRADVSAYSRRPAPMGFLRAQHVEETSGFVEALKDVSQQTGGRAQVFDPSPMLCSATSCSVAEGDRLLYFDASHLTDAGAERLEPLFRTAIKKLTGDLPSPASDEHRP